MKTAIQHPKQASRALVLTMVMMSFLPAIGQTQDLSRRSGQIMPASEAASFLAEAYTRENSEMALTRAGNQAETNMQSTRVCSFLTDIYCVREQDRGSAHDDLARKNALVQKYGLDTGLALFSGSIWVGMTSEMVAESIGEPCEVLVHDCDSKVRVQWVYRFYNLCLCFEDQVLTAIRYN